MLVVVVAVLVVVVIVDVDVEATYIKFQVINLIIYGTIVFSGKYGI